MPLKFAALDLLLNRSIYDDALQGHQFPLTDEAFNDSVVKISSTFVALWPHKNDEGEAVEWEMDLRDLYPTYKDVFDVSFWRWFLIVAAERVRTREKLPNLEVSPRPLSEAQKAKTHLPISSEQALLEGKVSVPQNVEPDVSSPSFRFFPLFISLET